MIGDILIVLVADILIGALFLTSGFGKLRNFATFHGAVENYQLLPAVVVAPATILILAAEIVGGGLAALGLVIGSQVGLVIIAAMLLLYAGAMALNLARGRRNIDCGCAGFGGKRDGLDWSLVVRNLALASVAAFAAVAPFDSRTLTALDWFSLLGALMSFPLLYIAMGNFMALRSMIGQNL